VHCQPSCQLLLVLVISTTYLDHFVYTSTLFVDGCLEIWPFLSPSVYSNLQAMHGIADCDDIASRDILISGISVTKAQLHYYVDLS